MIMILAFLFNYFRKADNQPEVMYARANMSLFFNSGQTCSHAVQKIGQQSNSFKDIVAWFPKSQGKSV